MKELVDKLKIITKKLNTTFTLKGRPLSLDELFSEAGVLPGLARRADQLSSLCLGYGLGVKLEDEEKGLLGKKVKFDEFTPEIIRIFCIIDVIHEFVRSAPMKGEVSVDELLYD